MRAISKLKVIECKYCYANWKVEISEGKEHFTSSIREFCQPRDIQLYHACGVYDAAGVPSEVCDVDYERYRQLAPCEGITRDFSDAVYAGIREGSAVLVAGGYCNYAPAVAGGIQRALGDDTAIGLVWIDAHADNRIVETSDGPVRMVGVPLSTMVGQTLPAYRKDICGLKVPLKGEHVLASDIRIMDEATANNLCKANILRLDASVFKDAKAWENAVKELASRVDVIYLSVDADILKAKYIPAYEKAVPYGQYLDVVMRNIRLVMETGKVCAYSVFCIDFDHYERAGKYTYMSGLQLIAAGLSNWSQVPLGDA